MVLKPVHQEAARKSHGFRPLPGGDLPRWPFAAMFVGFPLWWALGFAEIVWIALAAIMVIYLIRRRAANLPRGFGIWMMFLVWMTFSVIGIDTSGRLIGFFYRALFYLTVSVIFVYVYNARATLPVQYMLGVFTVFWIYVVAGGYAGIAFPLFSFQTPLSYVVPLNLQSNELVHEMVTRRLTQFNPDSWLHVDPRPSAPFLYTNGWGNVYSMLIPLVICYLSMVRRTRLFVPLLIAIPISVVPAFLTLNRGMLIGLGVAIAYAAVVLALRGHLKALLAVLAVLAVLCVGAIALDVGGRLDNRVQVSSSTEDRVNLYSETFERTLESPLFGYGAPRPSEVEGAPSVGTQGQIWMVMFSHGFPGLIFFMGWLLWSFLFTVHRNDPLRIGMKSVLLVIFVESFYYGVVPDGLILSMAVAAMLLRPLNGETVVPSYLAELPDSRPRYTSSNRALSARRGSRKGAHATNGGVVS